LKKTRARKAKKTLLVLVPLCKLFRWCFLLQKKTRADEKHAKTQKSCLFGVPTTFAKKAKKGEKRRKRISLPHNTFL
jgi:hypothetical protein